MHHLVISEGIYAPLFQQGVYPPQIVKLRGIFSPSLDNEYILLLQELIRFAMAHEGTKQLSIVDSVIANAISPVSDVSKDLDIKDRESISILFLEVRAAF